MYKQQCIHRSFTIMYMNLFKRAPGRGTALSAQQWCQIVNMVHVYICLSVCVCVKALLVIMVDVVMASREKNEFRYGPDFIFFEATCSCLSQAQWLGSWGVCQGD